MKKIILILSVLVLVLAGSFCNYNGEATLIVVNIGDIIIVATCENAYNYIYPGEEGGFTLTWPGHDDMHVNLITWPIKQPDKGESQSLWIKDGEYRVIEIGYYLDDEGKLKNKSIKLKD